MLSLENSRRLLILARIGFFALLASIFVVTLGPFQGDEKYVLLSDKGAHGLAFYCLAVAAIFAFPRFPRWAVVVVCSFSGRLIEILQGIAGRDAEWLDWLADSIGAVMAVTPIFFVHIYHRRLQRR